MAADDEIIGGVAIEITGDFSSLQSDFEAATAQAASLAGKMGEAIAGAIGAGIGSIVLQQLVSSGALQGITSSISGAISSGLSKIDFSAIAGNIKGAISDALAGAQGLFSDLFAGAGQVFSDTGTAFAGMASTVTASATEAAAAVGGIGTAAAATAATVETAATGTAEAVSAAGTWAAAAGGNFLTFWAGVGSSSGMAAGALALGAIAVGAGVAAVAMEQLISSTNAEITAQAILAAQSGVTLQDIATYQGADNSLGTGNTLTSLLGGGGLQAALDQLQQLAQSSSGVGQALSGVLADPNTANGIEALVAAFNALPDPVDRANLAVQLFGQNAAQALALMNTQTVEAVNNANNLAEGWDQATRESLQRISGFFSSIGAWLGDFSGWTNLWNTIRDGSIQAATGLETSFHTFFVQLGSDVTDATGNLNRLIASWGLFADMSNPQLGGASIPQLSDAQLAAYIKSYLGGVNTPGGPLSIQAPDLNAPGALGTAQGNVAWAQASQYDQATAAVANLTAHLVALGAQLASDPGNPFLIQAINDTGALIDKDQALIDKQDAQAQSVKNLAAAYGLLGIQNFDILLKGITDANTGLQTQLSGMQAFNDLAGKLPFPQLEDAAYNLEAKLQAAFDAGSLSASAFQADLVKINAALDATQSDITKVSAAVAQAEWGTNVTPIPPPGGMSQTSGPYQNTPIMFDPGSQNSQTVTELGALNDNLVKAYQNTQTLYDENGQLVESYITVTGLANQLQGTIVGTAQILASEGANSTLTLANAAQTLADKYAQITANVAAGTATIQDQAAAYDNWQLAILRVNSAVTDLTNEEHVLTASIAEQNAQGLTASVDEQAQLAAIKLALSGQSDLWKEVGTTVSGVFSTMSSGLTKALFDWSNFGKDISSMLDTIGQKIVSSLIDNLLLTKNNLNAITQALSSVISGQSSVGGALSTLGSNLHIGNATGVATPGEIAGATGEGGYMASGTFAGPLPAASDSGSGFGSQSSIMDLGTQVAAMTAGIVAEVPMVAANTAAIIANTSAVAAQTVSTAANIAMGNVIVGSFAAQQVADTTRTAADAVLNTSIDANTLAQESLLPDFAANTAAQLGETAADATDAAATATDAASTVTQTAADTADTAAEVANTAAVTAATAADTAAASASAASGAAGGLGSALGGISDALGGIGGIASLGVSIASGVVQGDELAQLNNKTWLIVSSSQGIENQVVALQNTANQYWPELTHLVDIWGTLIMIDQDLKNWGGTSGTVSGPGGNVVASSISDNTDAVNRSTVVASDLKGGLTSLSATLQKAALAAQGNVGGPEGNAFQLASSAGSTGITNASTAQSIATLIAGLPQGGQGVAPSFSTTTDYAPTTPTVDTTGIGPVAPTPVTWTIDTSSISQLSQAITAAQQQYFLAPTQAEAQNITAMRDQLAQLVSTTATPPPGGALSAGQLTAINQAVGGNLEGSVLQTPNFGGAVGVGSASAMPSFTPANLATALGSDALLGKLTTIADGLSRPVNVTVQAMNPLQAFVAGVRQVGIKI